MERPANWENWVDRQIREAQERGEFDNLPGMGAPLDLTPNQTPEQERMAEAVRLVVARRERAPRSPRMERAFKRLIWRYTRLRQIDQGSVDVQE